MSDQTYEGWYNRATWNVSLWLANEEPLYRAVTALAARFKPGAGATNGEMERCALALAPWLKSYCEYLWPNGVTPDGDALAECDWSEVAEHWLAD